MTWPVGVKQDVTGKQSEHTPEADESGCVEACTAKADLGLELGSKVRVEKDYIPEVGKEDNYILQAIKMIWMDFWLSMLFFCFVRFKSYWLFKKSDFGVIMDGHKYRKQ